MKLPRAALALSRLRQSALDLARARCVERQGRVQGLERERAAALDALAALSRTAASTLTGIVSVEWLRLRHEYGTRLREQRGEIDERLREAERDHRQAVQAMLAKQRELRLIDTYLARCDAAARRADEWRHARAADDAWLSRRGCEETAPS
jgi:hypothetical protein